MTAAAKFFVIELTLITPGRDEQFRLFRANLPAVQESARWMIPYRTDRSVV